MCAQRSSMPGAHLEPVEELPDRVADKGMTGDLPALRNRARHRNERPHTFSMPRRCPTRVSLRQLRACWAPTRSSPMPIKEILTLGRLHGLLFMFILVVSAFSIATRPQPVAALSMG